MTISICWLGTNDIILSSKNITGGPVAAFAYSPAGQESDRLYLISCLPPDDGVQYIRTLNTPNTSLLQVHLTSPTDYDAIYIAVTTELERIKKDISSAISWQFFLSSGTSQMSTIWVLLSQTSYNATLYQAEKDESGYSIKRAHIPFSIKTEYISTYIRNTSKQTPEIRTLPIFQNIIHESDIMSDIIKKTYKLALYDIPVFITGETGTGKELFARAIHENSSRKAFPFAMINCSALPENIAESILFGHSKGAFTGADRESKGLFEQNNGGTLFLDEIGELSLSLQVKLLRVLETGSFQRTGDMKTITTDVRVISATNRNIPDMIKRGTFREDLYYRIAGGNIHLPPLSERGTDSVLIAENFVTGFNEINAGNPYYTRKFLTAEASGCIAQTIWPGNIRELYHTLKRAMIFSENEGITVQDIENNLLFNHHTQDATNKITNLEEHLSHIKYRIIQKTLKNCKGNTARTARKLGYSNYQSITYFIKNYKPATQAASKSPSALRKPAR